MILYKFIEKSAGAVKQWIAVNDLWNMLLLQRMPVLTRLRMDYSSKALKYDIQILCSDDGYYWNETKSILVGLAAGATVLKDNTLMVIHSRMLSFLPVLLRLP